MLYPAPSRLKEPAAETIGYMGAVLFPVEVTPQDAKKPVELKLLLEFGICRDICIPAQSTLTLEIPPKTLASAPPSAILAALARVPRPQAERRPGDPELKSLTASLDGPEPRLEFGVRFAARRQGWRPLHRGARRHLCAAAQAAARCGGRDRALRGRPDAVGHRADLKGKTLTLTLVSADGASEAQQRALKCAVPLKLRPFVSPFGS